MTGRALRLSLIFGWLLFATASTAQTDRAAQDRDLASRASNQARAAARRWGIVPTVRIVPEGPRLEALKGGRIDVPLDKLRQLLGTLPDAQAEFVIAWLMAHEVWHQVQFRDGWTRSLIPAENRPKECEADAMGAYAALDASLVAQTTAPDEAAIRTLSSSLDQVIQAAERLETGNSGTTDHPTADQRRAAIRAGAARALRERVNSLSTDPARGLLRDGLAKIYDMRPDEPAATWARRTCESILHSGDGVGDLAVGTPLLNWNKTGDPPIVDFRVPYRNTGSAPIRVTMQIRSVSVPRLSPADRGKWVTVDLKSYTFDLAPGATYDLTGRLGWYATDDMYPRLIWPNKEDSVFNVIRLQPRTPATEPVRVDEVSLEASQLQASLSAIYNAAPLRFKPVSTNCEKYSTFQECELTLPVIGTSERIASIDQDGSSSVDLTIYQGASDVEASAAYSRFRGWLRQIYPTLTVLERIYPDGGEDARMTPDKKASLRLSKRKKKSGDFEVSATIDALTF
jgi:hypothetical protein